jgi:3-oxoacyl-[acyl-carrier protein] reductase
LQADVGQPDQARNLVETVNSKFGRIDLLVNNAGRSHQALFLLTPPDRFREVMQENLMSAVLCCQAVLPTMLRQGSGVIINISSASAFSSHVGLSAYAASKSALNAITAVLAKEVASKGIRVNAVAPSWVETDMIRATRRDVIQDGVRRIPLHRVAQPEEVAAVVAALARDDITYLIGQVVLLDGGGGR